jgi:hypothetical protein
MHNSQHDRFLSARPCKLTSGVNAFNYRWTEEAGFANPPWSLIPRVLRKVCLDRCRILLVVPEWPRATWYPIFRTLIEDSFVFTDPCYTDKEGAIRPKPTWDTRFAIIDGRRATDWALQRLGIQSRYPSTDGLEAAAEALQLPVQTGPGDSAASWPIRLEPQAVDLAATAEPRTPTDPAAHDAESHPADVAGSPESDGESADSARAVLGDNPPPAPPSPTIWHRACTALTNFLVGPAGQPSAGGVV